MSKVDIQSNVDKHIEDVRAGKYAGMTYDDVFFKLQMAMVRDYNELVTEILKKYPLTTDQTDLDKIKQKANEVTRVLNAASDAMQKLPWPIGLAAACAILDAYTQGKITFTDPLSCPTPQKTETK